MKYERHGLVDRLEVTEELEHPHHGIAAVFFAQVGVPATLNGPVIDSTVPTFDPDEGERQRHCARSEDGLEIVRAIEIRVP
ncbi:hypothetical protein [Actinomycetospora straminea]|uniref:Uncharacterized protein n=1 Tax=Actinomycetospora straminea TaxID=663607 RepID=A0ABP9FCP9_9PSEU|nr:hypothetical protein [Actinomycetospora straminea]MDD7936155.1 hypothetical protein [Actinomycetospora straminea]